jgi:hypothetical protein
MTSGLIWIGGAVVLVVMIAILAWVALNWRR